MDRRQSFSLWYFIAAVAIMVALQSVFFAPDVQTLAYSDFKTLLNAGRVQEVRIAKEEISGTVDLRGANSSLPPAAWKTISTKPLEHHPFVTTRVEDPGLVADLQAKHVRFSGRLESRWLPT